jgi:hypothetical protein
MSEKLGYRPEEDSKKIEHTETVREIAYTDLNPGDRIIVQTQNSEYQFQVYTDPIAGKSLMEISEHGKLAGTKGVPVLDSSIKVGQPVRYAEHNGKTLNQTSNVVNFRVIRKIDRAIRGADELSSRDKAAIEQMRNILGK